MTNDTDQLKAALAESEAKFRSIIEEAPVATALYMGRELIIGVANDQILSFWGQDRSAIGKRLEEAVPELAGQPFLEILDNVFTTGTTYEAHEASVYLANNGVPGTY